MVSHSISFYAFLCKTETTFSGCWCARTSCRGDYSYTLKNVSEMGEFS